MDGQGTKYKGVILAVFIGFGLFAIASAAIVVWALSPKPRKEGVMFINDERDLENEEEMRGQELWPLSLIE